MKITKLQIKNNTNTLTILIIHFISQLRNTVHWKPDKPDKAYIKTFTKNK